MKVLLESVQDKVEVKKQKEGIVTALLERIKKNGDNKWVKIKKIRKLRLVPGGECEVREGYFKDGKYVDNCW